MDENCHPDSNMERPRSSIPQPTQQRLAEITASEANSRNPTAMPPPSSLKHKPSNRTESLFTPAATNSNHPQVPEPNNKRKTLMARAAEIPATQPAATAYNRSINGANASAVSHGRNTSFASSNSSRMFSGSSRATSNASITGVRPPAAGFRPQSAMSGSKQQGMHAPPNSRRPATTLEHYEEECSAKRKGKVPTSHTYTPSLIQVSRQRPLGHDSTHGSWACPRNSTVSSRPGVRSSVSENPFREVSLSTCMQALSLRERSNVPATIICSNTSSPSKIPTRASCYSASPVQKTASNVLQTPASRPQWSRRSPSATRNIATPQFLSKESNVKGAAWDTQGRIDEMQKNFEVLREQMKDSVNQKEQVGEVFALYKKRLEELEEIRAGLHSANMGLKGELESLTVKLNSTTAALEDVRRTHMMEVDDLCRKHRHELDDFRSNTRRDDDRRREEMQIELDRLRRVQSEAVADVERRLKEELEDERARRVREVQDVSSQWTQHRQTAELDASARDREEQKLRSDIGRLEAAVELEKTLNSNIRKELAESKAHAASVESSLDASTAKAHFLESDSQAQSQAFADLRARMEQAVKDADDAQAKLRAEETLRRKLHNQVQELKGNIRVFCRVRPTLESDHDEAAQIVFPDAQDESKELMVTGPEAKSAIGTDRTSKHNFSFDRVFAPSVGNPDVFEEISQLVQSALDGYNVCIFCYGQTGSGKTHTMSSADGMIPLAVKQIFDSAAVLQEKGWKYRMEGSFVEVYNENLNDLLGKASDLDKKKLEVKHDMQRGKTSINEVTTMELDSPSTVDSLLTKAASNRSVAATKANERSSRSHSVFILKLEGENHITGEKSEGTLNLVDLAGSERLAHSGATGDRLKETQNINKSLSSLGDVIAALGQGKEGAHIPYRNSKLTYLLQMSLGGNSKTLMFVMVSPLAPHLNETITSLKFATKVHNTHIGTAKKQTKVKD